MRYLFILFTSAVLMGQTLTPVPLNQFQPIDTDVTMDDLIPVYDWNALSNPKTRKATTKQFYKTIFVNTIQELVDVKPVYNGQPVSLVGHTQAGEFWLTNNVTLTNAGNKFALSTPGWSAVRNYNGPINVRHFGAKGDAHINATTDDTVAIRNAFIALTNSYVFGVTNHFVTTYTTSSNPNWNVGANGRTLNYYTPSPNGLYFPAGVYRITSPNVFWNEAEPQNGVSGWFLAGDSDHASLILCDYAIADSWLFYNDDKYIAPRLRQIGFVSTSILNGFMKVIASPVGRPSNHHFENVNWTGNWNQVFYLDGTNNDSEWGFTDCTFSGNFNWMWYVKDGANGNLLLYTFYNNKFWNFNTTATNFYVGGGGNYNFIGCNALGYHSVFFMQKTGDGTSFPAQNRLSIHAMRHETQENTNGVFLDIDMSDGEVWLSNIDLGTQGTNKYYDTNNVNCYFRNTRGAGPKIYAANSTFVGKHKFVSGVPGEVSNNRLLTKNVVYDGCEFRLHQDPTTVFEYQYDGTSSFTNVFKPHIQLRNCRGKNAETLVIDGYTMGSRYVAWNVDFNWYYRQGFVPQSKVVSLRKTTGDFTSTTDYTGGITNWVLLPPYAVVHKVEFIVPANQKAITTTITITNNPAETNTLTFNSAIRTWTTNVISISTNILIGNNIGAHTTNLHTHLVASPFPSTKVAISGTNTVQLIGADGLAVTASLSGAWGAITYATNDTAYIQASSATWTMKTFEDVPTTFFTTAFSPVAGSTNTWTGLFPVGIDTKKRLIQLEPTTNVLQNGTQETVFALVHYY